MTHAKAAEPAALADEIEYLVDKYAIDESEAAARIEMQWYLPQFAESLRSDFSATFGGSWIDHATGEVVASFTHQPDRGAIAERFEFPGRVSVRQVQWTFDELVAGAQSLALARPPNAPGYGVRVDASRNVVQVLTGGCRAPNCRPSH